MENSVIFFFFYCESKYNQVMDTKIIFNILVIDYDIQKKQM